MMYRPSRDTMLKGTLCLGAIGTLTLYQAWSRRARRESFEGQCNGIPRSILITGGASGIGLNTCVLFLQKGWIVGVYDIDLTDLKAKILEIDAYVSVAVETNLVTGTLDVTDNKSCQEALSHFLEFTGGRIHCLFNCAGLLYQGSFDQATIERQRKIVEVNNIGVVQMTHAALEALKEISNNLDSGSIGTVVINMASVAAIGGVPNEAVYSASKSFVYSLTESLRSELWRSHRIRFCDVSVHFVDTPMVQTQNRKNFSFLLSRKLESIRPMEVARKVFYAACDCSYYRPHYYVRDSLLLFKLKFSLNFLQPWLGTVILDLHGLLPSQR